MKTSRLAEQSVQTLVSRFQKCALEQDKALLYDETERYNRLYREMDAIKDELKSRPGDERAALLPLLVHPNPQVRYRAGAATLAVAPREARAALDGIVAAKQFPQAGHVGMLLAAIDRGDYAPS